MFIVKQSNYNKNLKSIAINCSFYSYIHIYYYYVHSFTSQYNQVDFYCSKQEDYKRRSALARICGQISLLKRQKHSAAVTNSSRSVCMHACTELVAKLQSQYISTVLHNYEYYYLNCHTDTNMSIICLYLTIYAVLTLIAQ